MSIFKWKKLVLAILVGVFCINAVGVSAFADDDGKDQPSAKPPRAKIEAPAPLTERERLLLDRVELPSYVSSNTPWFFNGVRVQIFPTEHLKIEPWFVNGWQSYGRFNNRPGLGFQILWRPNGWLSVLGNQYMLGEDALNTPGRVRYHTDDSIQIKYYDNPEKFLSKAAFSLTGDMGCEHGGGVSCAGNSAKGPKQSFLGYMFYNRLWFDNDKYGLTIGGGQINNPGRYLVLLPPINGATASSGTPYFTENPGDPYKAWDVSGTFDWMPSQYITFRWEYNHRAANVPYFSGSGGVTPPGGNTGTPGGLVCLSGFTTCDGSPTKHMVSGSPKNGKPGDDCHSREVLKPLAAVFEILN